MRINEDNYDVLKRAEEITGTDSGIKWFDAENIDGYVDTENLLAIMEDLIVEYHRLEEKLEDKQDAWEPDPYKVHRDNVACGLEY